jgi:hypothetical protein
MSISCWKCRKLVSEVNNKISFRAQCPHCGVDLHTCTNCRYYSPGKPNDCLIPGTEWIKDREAMNFCEDFSAKLPSLTKDDSQVKGKDFFKSLFKDDYL